jgi:sugar lactone lactonase YvrE
MKLLIRIASSFLLLAPLSLVGFAQSGIITTYAGPGLPTNSPSALGQAIGAPSALAADGAGGYYVASGSQNMVYHVTASGRLSVTAGTGSPGFSGDGGPAISAQLFLPGGLAVDASGNLFIADSGNNRVRKVTPGGVISTIAGTGPADFFNDNMPAVEADLNYPLGLLFDPAGNLYIADTGNDRIRKVTTQGIISTIVGTGAFGFAGDEALADVAVIARPTSMAIDGVGNLYIADSANQRIREITVDGNINTIVGNGTRGFSGDGGEALSAELNNPVAVAVDNSNNVYIADSYNYRIRKVTPGSITTSISNGAITTTVTSGTITTIAGSGVAGFSGDGGPALSAELSLPVALMLDATNDLYVADYVNQRVREVTSDRSISTVAGAPTEGFSGDGSQAATALLHLPTSVAVDAVGNLYIADSSNHRIRKVATSGVMSTVAGTGVPGYSGDGGPATSALLNGPVGVALDASGNLFIADYVSQRVRKVTPGGVITTIAGNGSQGYNGDGGPATSAQLNEPWGLAVDASGDVFIADVINQRVRMVTPAGVISTVAGMGAPGFAGDGGPATNAQLQFPSGVAVDRHGDLFIADSGNNSVREVTPDGMINTFAGSDFQGFGGDGGPATSADLYDPTGVAVDSSGDLFVVDHNNNCIRKVTPNGIINTVVGTESAGFSGDGGPALSATLNAPMGMAVDTSGDLFIADYGNDRIRKVTPQNSVSSFFPQVVVGSGYSTVFAISNPGTAAASGVLKLTDPQGEPMTVSGALRDSAGAPLSSLSGSALPVTVPAGETVFLSATGLTADGSIQAGWGELDNTAGLLAGAATYEYFVGSTLQTVVDTLQSPLLQYATVAVDNDSSRGKQLAYAIANPGTQAMTITLTLVAQDGTVAGGPVTLTLGPKQQIAHYLGQDVACTKFSGSLVLQAQAGAAFAAVALLDNQGVMTAIPMISGGAALEAN